MKRVTNILAVGPVIPTGFLIFLQEENLKTGEVYLLHRTLVSAVENYQLQRDTSSCHTLNKRYYQRCYSTAGEGSKDLRVACVPVFGALPGTEQLISNVLQVIMCISGVINL